MLVPGQSSRVPLGPDREGLQAAGEVTDLVLRLHIAVPGHGALSNLVALLLPFVSHVGSNHAMWGCDCLPAHLPLLEHELHQGQGSVAL